MVRRKKFRLSKSGKAVGALVVGATGASVVGSALPGTTGAALQSAGTGMARFVGPAATIFGAGIVMHQLKQLPQPRRKRLKGGKR